VDGIFVSGIVRKVAFPNLDFAFICKQYLKQFQQVSSSDFSASVGFMMERDAFSQWLGIEILELGKGFCRLQMKVRPEMTNGFGIAHGGICFSLADTCLAFAANTYGNLSLTLKADISWPGPVKAGEVLIAESKELALSAKSGTYDVTVWREGSDNPVALFRGLVFRTGRPVIDNESSE
jgi:acyl-CoA thioesterase